MDRRLIDGVRLTCERLAGFGWLELLARHGLRIDSDDLAAELTTPLDAIDRTIAGFEDFAAEGKRGIEPGNLHAAFSIMRLLRRRSGATDLRTIQPLPRSMRLRNMSSARNQLRSRISEPVLDRRVCLPINGSRRTSSSTSGSTLPTTR